MQNQTNLPAQGLLCQLVLQLFKMKLSSIKELSDWKKKIIFIILEERGSYVTENSCWNCHAPWRAAQNEVYSKAHLPLKNNCSAET